VTVGGEDALGDQKTGAGDARPERRQMAGKADAVHSEHIADGIAIAIQNQSRHGFGLLELLYLG
jgi:hypothetical protein